MPRRSRKKVGIIGLGIIGSRVAAGLRKSGFAVYAWNRTPRVEPNFLGSPGDVAATCEIIQLFVPDGPAVMQTLEAMAGQISPDHVIVCSATIGPDATLEASRFVEERGAHFLDAPFTGSKGAAAKQELVYFVGGDDDAARRAEPVLRASSKAIVKVGSISQAATLKVATNIMVATAVQGLAEAFALVRASGIDPKRLGDAVEHHAARSPLVDMKLPKLLESDWEPQFSLRHMLKDLDLAETIASTVGIGLPATEATSEFLRAGLEKGLAELDFSSLATLFPAPEAASPPAPLPLPEPEPEPESDPDPDPEPVPSAEVLPSPAPIDELVSLPPAIPLPEAAGPLAIPEPLHVSPPQPAPPEPAPVAEAEAMPPGPPLAAVPERLEAIPEPLEPLPVEPLTSISPPEPPVPPAPPVPAAPAKPSLFSFLSRAAERQPQPATPLPSAEPLKPGLKLIIEKPGQTKPAGLQPVPPPMPQAPAGATPLPGSPDQPPSEQAAKPPLKKTQPIIPPAQQLRRFTPFLGRPGK